MLNPEETICWYCHSRVASPKASITKSMHRVLWETADKVSWQSTSLSVPRCTHCKQVHDRLTMTGAVISSLLPLYALFRIVRAGKVESGPVGWIVAIFVMVWIFGACALVFMAEMWLLAWPGRLIAARAGTRLTPVSDTLTALKAQGWREGTKPASAKDD